MWDSASRRKQKAVARKSAHFSEKTGLVFPLRDLGEIECVYFFSSFSSPLVKRQIEICMIRFVHFSNLLSDVFTVSEVSQRAPFNVTKRREVMKWSNYVSICGIQIKPGVKFPICAPAALSSSLCFSDQCRLLGGNKPDTGRKYYIQWIYLALSYSQHGQNCFPACVYPQNCKTEVMIAKRDL